MVPSVTRCSKTHSHSQGLQGWRSSVYVVPHVSCHLRHHETALDTTILHVVNEPAVDRLGARTQGRPRDHEQCTLTTQRRELSFATFCHHSVIQPFVGFLAVHVPQGYHSSSTLGGFVTAQHFPSIQPRHFWRHNLLVCCVLARGLSRVRRRSWALVMDVVLRFPVRILP